MCSWAIQFSLGLHEDGKGDEETRAVVEVSEEGGGQSTDTLKARD